MHLFPFELFSSFVSSCQLPGSCAPRFAAHATRHERDNVIDHEGEALRFA
jgi:hypothetical protein